MKHCKVPLLLLLIAALLLSALTGCGKKNTDPSDPAATAQPDKSGGDTAAATDEYIYVPKFVSLDYDFTNGISGGRGTVYKDGRLLVSSYGVVSSAIPEGVEPEWEGQYDVWGLQLYWVDLNGHVEKMENYSPVEAPKQEEDPDSAVRELGSSSGMQNLFLSPEGEIMALETSYRYWYDGPDDVELWSEDYYMSGYGDYEHNEQHYYLRTLNDDGSEKDCRSLDALVEQLTDEYGWFYMNSVVMCDDGSLLFTMDTDICRVSPEGELAGTIHSDYYYDSLARLGDGRIVVSYWGDGGQQLVEVDPETGALGEAFSVSGNTYSMTIPLGENDYDFYCTDGSNFMGYKLGEQKGEKVLNWLNCDVDTRYDAGTTILPDGRILKLESIYTWDQETNTSDVDVNLILLTKTPAADVAQKQKLTLAAQSIDWDIQGEIVKFNRSNPDYRIEVRDYSEYNTEEDYSAGLTKLTTEILAGNVPDIICLTGMPYSRLVSMELLADLYPLLDSDAELSRSDLFPAVMTALDDNGRLFRTVTGFTISTVVGAESVVGPGPGWTLAEFQTALARMPEGCEPFEEYVTRDEIFSQFLRMELDNLIDWSTGKCSFDTPAFKDILEFSAMFPESYEWGDDYIWTEENEAPNRIAAGKQMLLRTDLYGFDEYQMYKAMFGGQATFIGYPVSEGVGNALRLDSTGYAISAKCADKEAAWQFVRTFFTEKYQKDNVWDFPTNQAAFDAKLKQAMTPYYETNPDGSYVLDENGQPKESSRGGWSWGSIQIDFYAMTQEEADEVVSLISNTTRIYSENDEIMEIIRNDCEAYFAGQKSAEEVARLLQSKLNIYINEKR